MGRSPSGCAKEVIGVKDNGAERVLARSAAGVNRKSVDDTLKTRRNRNARIDANDCAIRSLADHE